MNPKSTIQNPKSCLNRVFVQALGTHAGRLYGLNTAGAAVGALLCGFWLINLLGVWGTLILAVLVNAVIGLSCILVGYKAQSGSAAGGGAFFDREESRRKDTPEEAANLQYPGAEIGALVIFAVSGFLRHGLRGHVDELRGFAPARHRSRSGEFPNSGFRHSELGSGRERSELSSHYPLGRARQKRH